MAHVCPWWGGYFIDNRFRRLLHKPEAILAPYVRDAMTVMDFGCGMGFFTLAMASLVGDHGHVIAIDLQQRMLEVLRKRADQAGLSARIHTHRCQIDSLDLADPVDFALAFYAAHEVPDMQALLRDILGCLRRGSHFLLVEPIGHVTAKRFRNMVTLAENQGFALTDRPRIRLSHAALLTKTCHGRTEV
ncbi:MAG: class I SAM-dependent methyltransferase [Planctomycetota bacterium]